MWYILTNSILAALVMIDSTKREVKSPPMWGIAMFLFGPFTLALYLARRPLVADEIRSGGAIWNYSRYFTYGWSLLMFMLAISQVFHLNVHDGIMQTTLHWAGLTLSNKAGLVMHAKLWLLPVIGISFVGLIFRRRSILEIGPTGPLAWSMPVEEIESAPASGLMIGAPTP
jgi:hypothetical protein